MLDPESKAKVERTTLPTGYSWGSWSGDYRIINDSEGREIARIGGLMARVTSGHSMGLEALREIMKGHLMRLKATEQVVGD